MIAGGAGGGALLIAVVAFFMCRRGSKKQSDATAELPQFSDIKQQIAAPVFTPSPMFLTPAVRTPALVKLELSCISLAGTVLTSRTAERSCIGSISQPT
jgi:hypothetical protein